MSGRRTERWLNFDGSALQPLREPLGFRSKESVRGGVRDVEGVEEVRG